MGGVPSQTCSSVLYGDLLCSNRLSNHWGGTTMPIFRFSAFHALVVIGGLCATPLFAQNPVAETNAGSAAAPPLFQGIVVDANGKTVGRLGAIGHEGYNTVIRQINGIWIELQLDMVSGFVPKGFNYWYQSSDCSGQPFLMVNSSAGGSALALPAQGALAVVSPAAEPAIYFAGTPSLLTIKSYRSASSSFCSAYGNFPQYFGLPQSVPLSSFGIAPPFSIK
jgi:hypothetical protein